MSDLIKRENAIATIGVMYERCGGDITDYRDLLLQCFKDLPSGRPSGEWEERIVEDDCVWTRHRWYCSECGDWQTYGKPKYCPNCGARMKGADDEQRENLW